MTESLTTMGLPDASICRTTRQTLDLARPGEAIGDETAAAALAEARRHLEECRSCQVVVRGNERLDRQIGEVCRDVPVPDDLKNRLFASIAEAGRAVPSTARIVETVPAAPTASCLPRRRWIGKLIAAAICLTVAGGGVWFGTHRPLPVLSLDQWIELAISENLTAEGLPVLTAHADGTLPQLPATMKVRYLTEQPRQLADGRGAAYFFQFPSLRGKRMVDGRLLVIPVRWIAPPPAATAFLSRPAVYLGPFCASIWVEGEFCYVCLVKGGENELHTLQARAVAT